VIADAPLKDVRYVACAAARAAIVLTWASAPRVISVDMILSTRVYEAQELAGDDGNDILLVVDVREVKVCVHVVCEGLVPNTGQAIYDRLEGSSARQMQGEIDAVNQRKSRTERMSRQCDVRRGELGHRGLDRREDSGGGLGLLGLEAIVHFDRRGDTGEQGGIQGLEEEIAVGQVSLEFGWISTLMSDDDGAQGWVIADIPELDGAPISTAGGGLEPGIGLAVRATAPVDRRAGIAVGRGRVMRERLKGGDC